jgi:excisionase family DNA binding protein
MQDRMMKPRECAEIANVKPRTIVRWIRAGELKATKVGHVWRIRAEDWERFLDGLTVE